MKDKNKELPVQAVPWKLGLVVLIGLLSTWSLSYSYLQPNAGRAWLNQTIPLGQNGWNLAIDAPRLWTGAPQRLEGLLEHLLDSPLSSSELETIRSGPTLVSLLASKPKTIARAEPAPLHDGGQHKLFNGTPGAIFQWSSRAYRAQGSLFRSPENKTIYSGPIAAILPFNGFGKVKSTGFSLSSFANLPIDSDRILIVDPKLISFPLTYRDRIIPEWKRWEFVVTDELTKAVGNSMSYAHWHNRSLFSFELQNVDPVKKAIAKRFPSHLVTTQSSWIEGSRAYALAEEGPAWLIRGSQLIAVRSGGLKFLGQAIAAAMSSAAGDAKAKKDPFWREVQRLAADQKGWNAFIAIKDPKLKLRWGVLLHWPDAASNRALGFLIVEPND